MITRIGKLLVFLNLLAAVALVTWAVSLTANRLDWVDRQDGERKVEGEITRLKKEIEVASKGIAETSATFGQQDRALTAAESGTDFGREGRDRRRAVFAARLKAAQDGRFADQVRLPNRVLIDVSREGNPARGPSGAPLEGVEVYQKRLDDALRGSQAAVQRIARLRAQFDELSNGQPEGIAAANKRIVDQRAILVNLTDEQRFLASVQVNWDEELRTLQTRRKQLERRLQSLASRGAPAGGPAE